MLKHLLISLAFLMTLSAPVAAQDFQKGLAAAQAGDFATALKEWKPLAEAGNADAQYNLGLMYTNGDGVPQDYKEAVKWYRLAAEQGYADAQTILVYVPIRRMAFLKTTTEAVKWYRLAAEQGDAVCSKQSWCHVRNGNGVLQDKYMAHMWYNIASANGHEKAVNGEMNEQANDPSRHIESPSYG